MIEIKKAIIPAAGRGVRVRSLAGELPKEMLPVCGKPMIQHAVEMHVRSGIESIAVILHPEKEVIRHFLEGKLLPSEWVAESTINGFRDTAEKVSFHFFYQQERRGVIDSVCLARDFVGDQWFALVMPDSLLIADVPFLAQLKPWASERADGIIGIIMLEKERMVQFGNVGLLDIEQKIGPLCRISHLSDKRAGKVVFAPPVHAKGFAGGIYSPAYFDYQKTVFDSDNEEIDDVPLHQEMAAGGRLYGVQLHGVAFDLGNVDGYTSAVRFLAQDESSTCCGAEV